MHVCQTQASGKEGNSWSTRGNRHRDPDTLSRCASGWMSGGSLCALLFTVGTAQPSVRPQVLTLCGRCCSARFGDREGEVRKNRVVGGIGRGPEVGRVCQRCEHSSFSGGHILEWDLQKAAAENLLGDSDALTHRLGVETGSGFGRGHAEM